MKLPNFLTFPRVNFFKFGSVTQFRCEFVRFSLFCLLVSSALLFVFGVTFAVFQLGVSVLLAFHPPSLLWLSLGLLVLLSILGLLHYSGILASLPKLSISLHRFSKHFLLAFLLFGLYLNLQGTAAQATTSPYIEDLLATRLLAKYTEVDGVAGFSTGPAGRIDWQATFLALKTLTDLQHLSALDSRQIDLITSYVHSQRSVEYHSSVGNASQMIEAAVVVDW